MFRVKYCREVALKLLYQTDILGLNSSQVDDLLNENRNFFKSLNDEEREFISKILRLALEQKEAIDRTITQNLIGWKLERLLLVDRNLLRIGIAESSFNDQRAVIIDDIVRIAKKYGSEESYRIINAILDKVIP